MASRKDLLKAYGFTSQRLIKALVDRNPEDMTSPLRRVAMGSFASVMIGVLLFGAFGVAGWLNPAKTAKWQKDKTVVVDKTSGGVYAYLDETLYPTYNIASAKLATAGGPTVAVTTKSLRTAPKVGPTIGIPGAPNQLPDPVAMTGAVRLCASAPQGGADRFTTVEIGSTLPIPAGNPAIRVDDDQGVQYLVIDGIAHLAPKINQQAIAISLGFPDAITPGNAFVNGLPKGATLDPPPIDGRGEKSVRPIRQATTIGTVLELPSGSGANWYVLLADGYATLSPIEATALQLQGAKKVTVDLNAISTAKVSATTVRAPGLPQTVPAPPSLDRDAAVCETWPDGAGPQISLHPTDLPAVTRQSSNANQADLVVTPPLSGLLVQPESVVDRDATVSLVTDDRRYGVADADALTALGYGTTPVRKLPDGLIELIPQGLSAGQILSIPRARPPG